MKKLMEIKRRGSDESGFTLLEYCAGAAVIIGIVWIALKTLGGNMSTFLTSIGTWATDRATEIDNSEGISEGDPSEGD